MRGHAIRPLREVATEQTQSFAGPGRYGFQLQIIEEAGTRYDSFLVVCTATDVDHPSAAAVLRLVAP